MDRDGCMIFLEEGHAFLDFSCKYIYPSCWKAGGYSPFTLSQFNLFFLIYHSSFILVLGLGHGGELLRMNPLFVGCSNCRCIPTMN
jgi:hypothetical protein